MNDVQPSRPEPEEFLIRLLMNDIQCQGNRVTSAAFRDSLGVSLFVRERLPEQDPECLHIGRFVNAGRAQIQYQTLLDVTFIDDKGVVTHPFNAHMSPDDCKGDLEQFFAAHAALEGPQSAGRLKALADRINELNGVDRPLVSQPLAGDTQI